MRIRRITIFTLRVPVPIERVNCGCFAHETLQRGPTGGLDGPWFADAPFNLARIEGPSGPSGWCDLSRGHQLPDLAHWGSRLLGLAADEISADRDPLGDARAPRGLHTAAMDWKAKLDDVPLYRLFGQRVRHRVPVAWWSGHRTPRGAASVAQEARSRGIHCLKLKSSLDADDAGIAAHVAESCGNDFTLVIDPNGRWKTFDQALDRAQAIARRRACARVWLEDPLYGNDEAVADIGRRTGIPVIRTARAVSTVQRAHALGFSGLNLVASWPVLLDMSREAQRLGMPFWAGTSVDSGLSDIAMVHFAITQPAFTMAAELAGTQVREHCMLSGPIPMADGCTSISENPGLGIETDHAAIEKYRVADPLIIE